jgi:serine phosphatase RsbU (regulator of sigma subunit)
MDPLRLAPVRETTVTKSIPDYLRLHTEDGATAARADLGSWPTLKDLCHRFHDATGWELSYASEAELGDDPLNAGQRRPGLDVIASDPADQHPNTADAPILLGSAGAAGAFRLKRDDNPKLPHAGPDAAADLAGSLADVLGDLLEAQDALWKREAELAAGVPVTAREDEPVHLADVLASVLESGAHALNCQAAALYVLDADTTELKLRCSFGLPAKRLIEPARELRHAVADLEAMLGHAVVLSDKSQQGYWNPPEANYNAAVCVPVSSPTLPLGTLWFFSEVVRDFDTQETNLAEIVAGRVAAELQREILLNQSNEVVHIRRQLTDVQRTQSEQLPRVAPLVDGWQFAGGASQAELFGGAFYDWSPLEDQRIAVFLGDADGTGLHASLLASTLRTAVRSHGEYHQDPAELVDRVNHTTWVSACGEQSAALYYGLLDCQSGRFDYCVAGSVGGLVIGGNAVGSLRATSLAIGVDPATQYVAHSAEIQPGEALVLYTASPEISGHGATVDEEMIAAHLASLENASAEQLADALRGLWEAHSATAVDLAVLVVKRLEA